MFPEYELVNYDCQFNDLIFDLIGYKNLQTKYFDEEYLGNISLCGKIISGTESETSSPISDLYSETLNDKCCKTCLKIYNKL